MSEGSQGSHDSGWTDESASSPQETIEFQNEIIKLINNAALHSPELKKFLKSIHFPSTEDEILEYIWEDSLHDAVWKQEQPFPPQDSDGPTELRWHTIYRLATDKYKDQLITTTLNMKELLEDPNFKWMPHTGGKRKRKTVIKKYRKKTVKRRTKKRKIHK